MTRIGLLSDTHAYLDERIFHHFENCDEIWHAGDIGSLEVANKLKNFKPLRAVYGNIDGYEVRHLFPQHNRFSCENVSVWLTHIGGYPRRYAREVMPEIFKNTPKLFVCGHSHILRVMYDETLNMLCMNPGAAGQYGAQLIPTLLRFEIDNDNIQNLEVIELNKKQFNE